MAKKDLIEKLQQIKRLAEECLADFEPGSPASKKAKKPTTASRTKAPSRIDFKKPLRPFIKLYSKGMSGPKKFTLLLARLAEGDLKKQVALSELQAHWNKMMSKSLLGMEFNRFFPAQARENDWVESKKKGLYNLRPSWNEIFR